MTNRLQDREYWEKRLSLRFDLTGVGDIGLPASYNLWLYRVRRRVFDWVIRELTLQPGEFDVLDVGSGTGFYVEQWLEHRPKCLVGSDLTQAAVARLKERFPNLEFTRCDIAAPLPSTLIGRTFDVVSAMDMLFHITDDQDYQSAVDNLVSLVKPGGVLIFSDNLMQERIDGGHQVCRTESYIRSSLERNGCVIERIIPMFALMNDPVRSRSKILRKFFSIVSRAASQSEAWGNLVGSVLFLPDLFVIRLLKRGPSTEVVVCRRPERKDLVPR